MNRFNINLLLVALCLAAAPAVSADFDGSKALICSAIETHDCIAGTLCDRGLAEDINVPQFIRLDFAAKTLSARGRSSPMKNYARADGMLVIQGVENKRAVSITINEESGKLVGAIATDEEGFIIFGACTPL
jgi:hypothetical protein